MALDEVMSEVPLYSSQRWGMGGARVGVGGRVRRGRARLPDNRASYTRRAPAFKCTVGPSIRPICTSCCFTMTIMIQVGSNFRLTRVFIINTRADEIKALDQKAVGDGRRTSQSRGAGSQEAREAPQQSSFVHPPTPPPQLSFVHAPRPRPPSCCAPPFLPAQGLASLLAAMLPARRPPLITQLKAQGPSRTCNEGKGAEEEGEDQRI